MKSIVSLISLFFTTILLSQSDFRSGYIIKNNYDTVWGLIDYRDDNLNSKKCIFKESSSSEKIEYSPGEINSYRFLDSKFYLSKIVPQDFADSIYFLECLVKGKVTVYFLRADDDDYYFLENEEGSFDVADNKKISISNGNGNQYEKKSNQYKGLFSLYFQDCPEILPDIKYLSYSRKPIIKIARTYHEKTCDPNDPCIVFEREIRKNKIKYGIVAPSGNQKFDFLNEPLAYTNGFSGELKSYWGIGGIVSMQLSDWNEQLYLEARLIYNSMYAQSKEAYEIYVLDYSIDASGIRSLFNLTYIYPKHMVKPLIYAGFSLGKLKYKNFKGYRISSNETLDLEINEPGPQNLRIGAFIGGGIMITDHFRLSISYDIDDFIAQSSHFMKNGLEYSVSYFF